MSALECIFLAAVPTECVELNCTEHKDWYADVTGADLPTTVRKAMDHIREDHRVHVAGCACRGNQVFDTRCIPRMALL